MWPCTPCTSPRPRGYEIEPKVNAVSKIISEGVSFRTWRLSFGGRNSASYNYFIGFQSGCSRSNPLYVSPQKATETQ